MASETDRLKLVVLLLALVLVACGGRGWPSETPTPTGAPEQATPGLVITPSLTTPSIPASQVRPSALAGTWYPADPDELAKLVDEMLAPAKPADGAPIGLIVPHAGYAYSGPVAAVGFKQLAGKPYDVAVIIAADHQEPISNPISVWAEGAFQTPLGLVPVDTEVAQALIAADPRIKFDRAAHAGEHPVEIELPFLQRTCPRCRIVPILMGRDDDETVKALADALLKVLPGRRAVVIASSDLSHYPAYQDALNIDGATLDAISTGDPGTVRATIAASMAKKVPNLATCACGAGPILVTMRVAQGLGADTVSVLHYANSGDAPQGDKDQVVGYGAVMFQRYEPPDLSPQQREQLLNLARTAIAEQLKTGHIPDYKTDDPILSQPSGAFVTLKERGELRGCIGNMTSDKPLYRLVQEMAVAAAFSDPRFPALTQDELSQAQLEISVLSPLHRITDPGQIQVGTHGLMISKFGQQGVFLPQVPVEQGWNRDQYLEGLCGKAGLPPGCWREEATLYTFTAEVFGEDRR